MIKPTLFYIFWFIEIGSQVSDSITFDKFLFMIKRDKE